jgi:hypothetical protein
VRAEIARPHRTRELWILGVEGALDLLEQSLLVVRQWHDNLLP